jgi:hypothetical protein
MDQEYAKATVGEFLSVFDLEDIGLTAPDTTSHRPLPVSGGFNESLSITANQCNCRRRTSK